MIGNLLPKLLEITNFIDRCNSVVVNTVQQLSSLTCGQRSIFKSKTFDECEDKKINTQDGEGNKGHSSLPLNTHLISIFQSVGDLLSILETFDHIIDENEFLRDSWNLYKVMITIARSDPISFGTSEIEIGEFEKMLVAIDSKLFKGTCALTFKTDTFVRSPLGINYATCTVKMLILMFIFTIYYYYADINIISNFTLKVLLETIIRDRI